MINILLNGCNGKMGQEVIKLVDNDNNFNIICGISKSNINYNNFPIYTDIKSIVEKPDVIIDFSIPSATLNILEYAKSNTISIVIATTGFSDNELKIINAYSKFIPIFKSANMSFDINLMSKIVSQLAVLLKNNDIEIIETHHNKKIDSPSGTAKFLANNINSALGNTMTYEYNRLCKSEKRSKNEIGFSSIRGGNIVGEHTVKFFGENETFEITHTSYSRTVFAEGALKAAKFIIGKPAGIYNMDNLIKT